MFTTKWSTSERKYDVTVDRDVKVRMPDGTALDGNIYRPASNERFPVILGAHAYNKDLQSPPIRPVGFTPMRGYMESGDSTFAATESDFRPFRRYRRLPPPLLSRRDSGAWIHQPLAQ